MSRIEELQMELSLLEVPYAIAKRRESGEDEEWNVRKKVMTERVFSLVKQFKPGDEPHKAVALISQAALLAAELAAPAFQVQQYREKKQLLKMAQADAEARKNEVSRFGEQTLENLRAMTRV